MTLNPLLPISVIVLLAGLFCAYIVVIAINKQKLESIIRRFFILLLLIVILLRPMIRSRDAVLEDLNVNVYFALDLTNSMVAKDCSDNAMSLRRFEKAKQDILKIAAQFKNAQFAILAQDFAPHSALSLTSSMQILEEQLASLHPSASVLEQNSSIDELLNYSLEYISENTKDMAAHKSILYILSDGENIHPERLSASGFNNSKDENLFSKLIPDNHYGPLSGGAVLAYGSDQGSYIEKVDEFGDVGDELIVDKNGAHYLVKRDETKLRELSQKMKLNYLDLSQQRVSESELVAQIQQIEHNNKSISGYYDSYYIFALILLLLLFWEFSDDLNTVLKERKAIRK